MKVPKGDQFLPDAGIGEPGTLHKKEANARAGDRLPAYMARKDGGPGRPRDIKRPGPARRPAAERPAELKEDPVAGPQAQGLGPGLWAGGMAAGRAPGRYGVRYAPRTMQELPRGTGPGRAKPRPRHPRAAPGEEGKAL